MPTCRLASVVLFLSLSASMRAQDTKKPPPWEFSGDLGFVNVSGNTSITTLNAGERLIRRLAKWEFKHDFATVYGKTDGKESSNLLRASLRSDFALASKFALYGRTAFERNKFAGIKSRFSEGAGVVGKLIATDVNQLNLEGGLEATQEKTLGGDVDNFASFRGATSWKHSFSKTAFFFQGIEALENLKDSDDLRVNTETALVAPLSTHVALKVSYVVRFDNDPALNAAKTGHLRKSDRIFSTGVQISF
jgi:putative salt-induced outer membrane protein